MNKKAVMSTALLGLIVVVLGFAFLWRSMSKKYIAKWDMPSRSTSATNAHGNVCIVQHPHGTSQTLACADVHLFPGVYSAIGVDEGKVIKWQDEHGFHSGGAAPDGALLVPEYPIFSRLAWTHIDPVYLQGADLSALLEETKRISEASNDPAVRDNLGKLSALATEAQQRSQVLRFFG
jgi:hypothetical protein